MNGTDGTGFTMLWVERKFEQERVQSDLVDKRHLRHVTTPAFVALDRLSQAQLSSSTVLTMKIDATGKIK